MDPGGARPTVASDWPRLPSPFAAATMAPVDGRMATKALAGLCRRQRLFRELLQPDIERRRQRLAWHRLHLEEHDRLGFGGWRGSRRWACRELPARLGGDQSHPHAGRATHLSVVAFLQSGQPDLVSGAPWRRRTSSTSSLVASPTVPMIGRAKSRVGASIWLVRMESAPGMARIFEPSGRSGASIRSTIAGTNASLLAAATFARVRFGVDLDYLCESDGGCSGLIAAHL